MFPLQRIPVDLPCPFPPHAAFLLSCKTAGLMRALQRWVDGPCGEAAVVSPAAVPGGEALVESTVLLTRGLQRVLLRWGLVTEAEA